MKIKLDNLKSDEIAQFLEAHLDDMRSVSPPDSKHALDIDALRSPGITFWSVYEGQKLVGCGALKEIDSLNGEIKSMRVCDSVRGTGLGSKILTHIIDAAKGRGYVTLKLETGSMRFFEPARKLYLKHGFNYCPPFGTYQPDPNSVFMELQIIQ